METLRVLLVTTFYPPYHLGGDAVHVQYLADALADKGHEVHVEFSPAAYRLKRKRVQEPERSSERVTVHPIPATFGRAQPMAAYALGSSRSVTRFHERLLREVRPDVIHCHNISLLGLGVVRRQRGARLLYTAHDYWARCPRGDLQKFGKRLCESPACATCALVSGRPPQLWRYGTRWKGLPALDVAIAPSQFVAEALRSSFKCPVVHIPNFAPDANPEGALGGAEGYFLFVGTLEPHKGVRELAEAAVRLSSSRVKVVGSGSLLGRLREAQTGSDGRLEVEGWVRRERLEQLYRHASALVVPSLWPENAPLVALEALSWGTPILVSRAGGLEELLHEGRAGRSFAPNRQDLTQAMEEFEREGLQRSLRASARRVYEQFHQPEAYLSRYIDLVRKGAAAEGSQAVLRDTLEVAAPPPLGSVAGGIAR